MALQTEELIQKCSQNPLTLKNIPIEIQNEKMISAACEACKNHRGLNPLSLKKYIRKDLQDIISNYKGHWVIGMNSVLYWYDS